jgi:hypothetical protein
MANDHDRLPTATTMPQVTVPGVDPPLRLALLQRVLVSLRAI